MDDEIFEAFMRMGIRLAAGKLDDDAAMVFAWVCGRFLDQEEPATDAAGAEGGVTPTDLVVKDKNGNRFMLTLGQSIGPDASGTITPLPQKGKSGRPRKDKTNGGV